MLSKNKIKYIRSLEQKKYRKEEKAFLAEGHKLVGDLSGHFECRLVAATSTWLESHPDIKADEIVEVSEEELKKASLLKTPQDVLAVFRIPETDPGTRDIAGSLCLALDDVQDPGNLGTILRTADWFGIRHVFCSIGTADAYNPKTVQATMGAIARVRLHYLSLAETLQQTECDYPIYGTLLEGKNIYERDLKNNGLIIMGNEGKGLSPEIRRLVTDSLYIPSYPTDRPTSESLNVAIATAIVCAEFRRRG